MNKYLEKTAQSLPYRLRSEVLIHKDGKVLITVNGEGDNVWHGLPGGGVEEGQSPADAARQEALEEVGIAVKNIRDSGESSVKEGYLARKGLEERQLMYRGSKTHLFEADFDKEDKTILGTEGDRAKYKWMTPTEAHALIKPHSDRTGNSTHQVRALQNYL